VGVIDRAIEKLRLAGSLDTDSRIAPSPVQPVAAYPTVPVAKRITLDLLRLRNSGYLPEEGQDARFAEYYRELKRPLIQKAMAVNSAHMRLILISSALPGDGKTFTSLNLALSMARERDISVLLVDADLPKGHISSALGLHDEPGLTNSLLDASLDVESLIVGTDISSLAVLPSGRQVAGATELIASSRMTEVVARLSRNPRRLVLLDTPPLLVSSESRALSLIPAQLVLVVRSGHTPRQALLDAISKLDKRNLHLVLNDAHIRSGGGYYGYYGYGYPSAQAAGKTSRIAAV
jgi:protein-tyrosine kinase